MKKRMLNIKGQRGAAAVEFAIILPVLVLLLFGSIEFGLLLFNKQVITNASREGARAGIVLPTNGSRLPLYSTEEEPNSVEAIVRYYCEDHLVTFDEESEEDPLSLNISAPDGQDRQDDLIVTATYNYGFFVLGNLGFDNIALKAETVMKYE